MIPSGSTLFNIYATDNPAELGGTEQLIGKLVTASNIFTSLWGDEHMFFRHQRIDDDIELRPDWEPFTKKFSLFGNT
jgi:hypothetical protein